jgi:hypothetical protein
LGRAILELLMFQRLIGSPCVFDLTLSWKSLST